MQFSCESCKVHLQIADEKVRGRRLIVRCKRCGAKIALADPLLSNSPPRVVEPAPPRPATDTESTRAMDRDLLERALQASRAEDGSVNGSPLTQRFAAPSPPVPANPAVWFAMLQGKQTGPLTRAELEVRANQGDLGPRTYVWCEGMDSWQHAKEVLELADMFPPLPAPPSRPPSISSNSSASPAQAGPGSPQRPPAQAASGAQPSGPPAVEGSPAQIPPDEPRATAVRPTPVVQRAPMFEGAARTHEHGPGMVFFVALSAFAAAAVVLWLVLGSSPGKSEAQRPQARAGAQAAPPAAIGLTADQVRRKLDEHKPALQDCVNDALRQDPTLRVGKIHVATTIAPSGQVTAARIDRENVDESPLGACLKRATRKIVFPQFSGVAFDVDIPISVGSGE
jgi:predicted Zn finger-like uncharacterized protein